MLAHSHSYKSNVPSAETFMHKLKTEIQTEHIDPNMCRVYYILRKCLCVCKQYFSTGLCNNKPLYIQWSSWDEIYNTSMIKTSWRGRSGEKLLLDVLTLLQLITTTVDVLNVWKADLCSCDILTSGVWRGTGLKLADVRFTMCTAYDTLCPYTLDLGKDKLRKKKPFDREKNGRKPQEEQQRIPLSGQRDMQ